MKNLLNKVLVVAMSVACTGLLLGCGQTTSKISDEEAEFEREMDESDISEDEEDTAEEEPDTAEEETEATEEESETTEEEKEKKEMSTEKAQENTLITEYIWQASGDSSLIVCKKDGSFKYYQSADELNDNYYEGTYEFYMGKDAVSYITTELSAYGVTKEELEGVFDRNEQYEESNFVIFVLNNEACIIDGENQVESPYQTPYFGFYLEDDGVPYLDIANMNTGNYHLFVGK